MIDTITLLLSTDSYHVISKDGFYQSINRLGVSSMVQNPPKPSAADPNHYPHLTISNRLNSYGRSVQSLKIQSSLPKLLYGNNFDELSNKDFPQVIAVLKTRLHKMGIEVTEDQISHAEITGIHYGKNFVLTDGRTPKIIIDKLAQGDYSRRLDVEMVKYRNNGLGWKLHTNRYELAFYDKLADLHRAQISEKRSEEYHNSSQINLFKTYPQPTPFEVLRMEARLNNKAMINHMFEKLKITTSLTFNQVFSESIAKKVLLSYLDMIESARPPYSDYIAKSSNDLLAEVKINNSRVSPCDLLSLVYLKQLLDQGETLGSVRQIISPNVDSRWNSLIKKANIIEVDRRIRPFSTLRSQIENYVPLKLNKGIEPYENNITR